MGDPKEEKDQPLIEFVRLDDPGAGKKIQQHMAQYIEEIFKSSQALGIPKHLLSKSNTRRREAIPMTTKEDRGTKTQTVSPITEPGTWTGDKLRELLSEVECTIIDSPDPNQQNFTLTFLCDDWDHLIETAAGKNVYQLSFYSTDINGDSFFELIARP